MKCFSYHNEGYDAVFKKVKPQIKQRILKHKYIINGSIHKIPLCKGKFPSQNNMNMLPFYNNKYHNVSNKKNYSFNDNSNIQNTDYKIDRLKRKINDIINIIDNFRETHLNINERMKSEINMLLSNSVVSAKNELNIKTPISHSFVLESTNTSIKDNIVYNEEQKKIQNIKEVHKRTNQRNINNNVKQIKVLYHKKNFMKTQNHIYKSNYNKNIKVSYRKTLKKSVINNPNKSLVKHNYKTKPNVSYKSNCSIINNKNKKKHLIKKNNNNTIIKIVNKSRQNINNSKFYKMKLLNNFTQLKDHKIHNIEQLHFANTKQIEPNSSYLSIS